MTLRRREFIAGLGIAAAWPLAARAQPGDRVRRIGMLMGRPADDPEAPVRVAAFAQELQQLGWTIGRNLRIDYRWGAGNTEDARKYATQLAALAPEVVVANGSAAVGALQQVAPITPTVFVTVVDPVGAGFVESLARPGGNVTGFTLFEYSISGKWLELLKQIAPSVTRVAVLRDTDIAAGSGQLGAMQSAAQLLGMELHPGGVRDAVEIERGVTAFAHGPGNGLIVTGSGSALTHREFITGLAARLKLPTVYHSRLYVAEGGLISYGTDLIDQFRRAAGYVDRILKGQKPADLPVQAPTKYELVINLKTAKALGLTVPPTLFARADEVIE